MQGDKIVSELVKTCNVIVAHFWFAWFAWLVEYANVNHSSQQGVLDKIDCMLLSEPV